jgi:hypothetical protein
MGNLYISLKRLGAASLLLAVIIPGGLFAASESARINKITFEGNRVSEATLRSLLPMKEGGELTPKALEESYDALYGMKLFKSVAISTEAAGEGLAEVHIKARDGWFLIPLPFAASGPSGRTAGLILFSRNIFRRAEMVSLFGSTGGGGGSAGAFVETNGRLLSVRHSERGADERLFTDGGFSSAQNVRTEDGKNDFSKYGTVAALYRRRQNVNSVSAGFPLLRRGNVPRLSGSLSYTAEKNDYGAGLRELHDGGRASRVSLGVNAGGREKGDDLGVIFGMGLADMEQRLRQSVKTENKWRGGLSVDNAGAWSGSDYNFSKTALTLENSTVWGAWNRLMLRCGAAVSAHAPESQLPATGRETGLIGQYVREFRAPRLTNFGALLSKPLTVSRRGTLVGAVFAETAFDPAAYSATVQDGAGISLSYRFWRFPLPLGLTYTYSFRDRDLQVSAAIGGRF